MAKWMDDLKQRSADSTKGREARFAEWLGLSRAMCEELDEIIFIAYREGFAFGKIKGHEECRLADKMK